MKKEDLGPDPLWPVDAKPIHLSPAQQEEAAGQYVSLWKCSKCGRTDNPSKFDPTLCDACYSMTKPVEKSWQQEAQELGLELFERQPDETNMEWMIWQAYRGHYPLRMPTYTQLAKEVNVSVGTVVRAANKWNFKQRILEWSVYADSTNKEERIKAVQDMHRVHLDTAHKMMDIVQDALETVEPALLKPNEILNMAKLATELQKQSTMYEPQKVELTSKQAQQQQTVTKKEDIKEIASILAKAGALVGMEQTTRVVIKGDTDNAQEDL